MTTGQTIRSLRKKRCLTQKELGQLCGLHGSAISLYERDAAQPKRAVLEALASALDVPLSVLTSAPAFAQHGPSAAPLFDGLVELLSREFGPVEEKTVTGNNGTPARYYSVAAPSGSFILHHRDLDTVARAAQASLLPLVERLRSRQALEKLG